MSNMMKSPVRRSAKRLLFVGLITALVVGLTTLIAIASRDSKQTSLSKRPTNTRVDDNQAGSAVVRNQVQTPRPGELTLVWFSATWCEICKVMRPFISNVVAEFPNVHLEEHDVDRESQLAKQHFVRGTPTFVFVNSEGKEILRFNGASERGFRQQIERALSLI